MLPLRRRVADPTVPRRPRDAGVPVIARGRCRGII